MITPFAIPGIIISIVKFWSRIPTPIRVIVYIILAMFVGIIYGSNKEKAKCEAQKQESIAKAIKIDRDAQNLALKNSQVNESKYREQALKAENKLQELASQFTTLPEGCKFDENFLKLLNSDPDFTSDRLPGVQPGIPKPPGSR